MASSDRIKIKLALGLLAALAGLCGCAQHQYLMNLTNGDQIISFSKPSLQGASYHFTDDTGTQHVIPQSRVAKVRTVSVVKPRKEPATPDAPLKSQPRRHWYFLWLA